jgi:hypothetical protein
LRFGLRRAAVAGRIPIPRAGFVRDLQYLSGVHHLAVDERADAAVTTPRSIIISAQQKSDLR